MDSSNKEVLSKTNLKDTVYQVKSNEKLDYNRTYKMKVRAIEFQTRSTRLDPYAQNAWSKEATFTTQTAAKTAQSITFNPLSSKQVDDDPFHLTATSTSGLSIAYTSSNASVATVAGTILTIRGAGTTTITASQVGNGQYKAASSVSRVLTVTGGGSSSECIGAWDKTFGGSDFDLARGVISTNGGGYMIVGYGRTNIGGYWSQNVFMVKTDASGNKQWDKTFGGNEGDGAWSVIQTSDGGYALVGYTQSKGAGGADIWLIKTDSSGNLQWDRTFGGSQRDQAKDLIQTSDGGYVIVGYTESMGSGNGDMYLIKTNSSGRLEWEKTFGGSGADGARSFASTSDGGYILAGYTESKGAGKWDGWVVKVTSSGNLQWDKTFGGSEGEAFNSVVVSSSNSYVLAGGANTKTWLLKVDNSGNKQWEKKFDAKGGGWAEDVFETSDNGYILAGIVDNKISGNRDMSLIKTDHLGNSEWNKAIGGSSTDEAYSATQSTDGKYILAGWTSSKGAGSSDFWLVKTCGVKQAQNITFKALPSKQVGDDPFHLTATSTSGLSIAYTSSNASVATVSGTVVTIMGIGTTTITASQVGNGQYEAASSVSRILTVQNPPPILVANPFVPADNATNVDYQTHLQFALTKSVVAVANKYISIYHSGGTLFQKIYATDTSQVSISSTTITINPSKYLEKGKSYYILVDQGSFQDTDNNPFIGISQANTWNFSIESTLSTPSNLVVQSISSSQVRLSWNAVSDAMSYRIYGCVGTYTQNLSGTTSYIINNLSPNTLYSYKIEALDSDGNKSKMSSCVSARTSLVIPTIPQNITATVTSDSKVLFSWSSVANASYYTILSCDGGTIYANNISDTQYTVLDLTPNTEYSFVVRASNSAGSSNNSNCIKATTLCKSPWADVNVASPGNSTTAIGSVTIVDGNTVTLKEMGTTTITASQAGNANYKAAASIKQTLIVGKAPQSITLNALPEKTFGDAPFIVAPNASSGLRASLSSSNTDVATVIRNMITIVGVGTTEITANQSGNAKYNAATTVTQTLTVNKAAQTITFSALEHKTFGDRPFKLEGKSESGLPLTYESSNERVAKVSPAGVVVIVGVGTTKITAQQAGNANYKVAAEVEQILTINKKVQIIDFKELEAKANHLHKSFQLSGTINSDLQINYSSSNEAVATISGKIVTIVGAGTSVIIATQVGDANHEAAAAVSQVLTVKTITGISPNLSQSMIKMYPNPTQEHFTLEVIDANEVLEKVHILNSLGVIVKVFNQVNSGDSIDISQLPAGMYTVQIWTSKGIISKKLVVK